MPEWLGILVPFRRGKHGWLLQSIVFWHQLPLPGIHAEFSRSTSFSGTSSVPFAIMTRYVSDPLNHEYHESTLMCMRASCVAWMASPPADLALVVYTGLLNKLSDQGILPDRNPGQMYHRMASISHLKETVGWGFIQKLIPVTCSHIILSLRPPIRLPLNMS